MDLWSFPGFCVSTLTRRALTALVNTYLLRYLYMQSVFWVCDTQYKCTHRDPNWPNTPTGYHDWRTVMVVCECVCACVCLFNCNVMKAMAPLGLPSCRITSYHSRWRKTQRQIEEETKRGGGDRGKEAENREMIMPKAAVKSDLLAHQDLSAGTGGGEGCRENGVKRVRVVF